MSDAFNCDGAPGGRPVFTAGVGRDRLQVSVCPGRLLESPEAREIDVRAIVEWWLMTTPRDPWSGMPCGMPEWPRGGGMLNQRARLVEAVQILMAAFPEAVAARRAGGAGARVEAATTQEQADNPSPNPGKAIRAALRARP